MDNLNTLAESSAEIKVTIWVDGLEFTGTLEAVFKDNQHIVLKIGDRWVEIDATNITAYAYASGDLGVAVDAPNATAQIALLTRLATEAFGCKCETCTYLRGDK